MEALDRSRGEERATHAIAIAVCLLMAGLIYALVFLSNHVISNIDFLTHYRWLSQFHAALAEGTIYPRWMPLANLGLGEIHYSPYPLYYYLASLLVFLVGDPWLAIKLLGLLSAFLGGLIVYLGLRRLAPPTMALAGAVLFQASPFALFLFTHHGAMPWHFSLPLAAGLLLLALPAGKPTSRLGLALAVAALAMTHVLVAFMTVLCLSLVWLTELARRRMSIRALVVEFALPVALGVGLMAFHLAPAVAVRGLLPPNPEVDPLFLHWRNSFVFPTFSAALWGTRWFSVQVILPALSAIGLATGLVALWTTRMHRDNLWLMTAHLCAVSALGFVFSSELSYPLYAFLKPFQALQWPYRFVTVAVIGAALAFALAMILWRERGALRGLRLAWCIALAAATVLLLAAVQVQALRQGVDLQLSPRLLQGEFRQQGNEFATIGPEWRAYVQNGGFEAQCARAEVRCEQTHRSTQRRQWSVSAEKPTRLVLPLFAFPGWRVTLDGNSLPFATDPATGLIAVEVPAGAHALEVSLAGLREERYGLFVSLGSGAVLLLWSLQSGLRRRRIDRVSFAGSRGQAS
jgi:hypothetical protein